MTKKAIVLNLIKDYLNEVRGFMECFSGEYGRSDMLKAWREGLIEKDGSLPGGIDYELHGIGCRIYKSDCELDFDFGPENRTDGFDLWRLKGYLSQRTDIQKILDIDDLSISFNELESEGVIVKLYGNSSLYFLAVGK